MATQNTNQNLSIDIDRRNITASGYCDLKCSFSFKYPESNLTIKNNTTNNLLNFTLERQTRATVFYKNEKYIVEQFTICSPSLHTFNGEKTAGEIVIGHRQETSGQNLLVCIPLIKSSDTSTASRYITNLIKTCARSTPSAGNTATLNASNFTLQSIVPNKPFYTYAALSFGKPNFIVYSHLNGIPINNETVDTLKRIIQPYPEDELRYFASYEKGSLYYNSKGPTKYDIGDGIYISCKPTGSFGEEIPVEVDSSADGAGYVSSFSSYSVDTKYYIQLFISILSGCALFIIVLYVSNFLYGYLTTNKPFTAYVYSTLPAFLQRKSTT